MKLRFWKRRDPRDNITAEDRAASLQTRRMNREQRRVEHEMEMTQRKIELEKAKLDLEKVQAELEKFYDDDEDDEDYEDENDNSEIGQILKLFTFLGIKIPNSNLPGQPGNATNLSAANQAAAGDPASTAAPGTALDPNTYVGQLHMALKFPGQVKSFIATKLDEKQREQLVDDISKLQDLVMQIDEKENIYED